VLLIAVVAGAAWVTLRLVRSDAAANDAATRPAAAMEPARLRLDHDYYLWIRLIELTPEKPGGGRWDVDRSGPDIRFVLWWKGNKIYTSDKRPETLIGKWDLIAADMFELVKSQKIEIERAIQMPLVRIEKGASIHIQVVDADLTTDDAAGGFELQLDELRPSVNTLRGPEGSAIVRVEVEAIDSRTPLPELIDLVTRR
jgi:hypothetical protein